MKETPIVKPADAMKGGVCTELQGLLIRGSERIKDTIEDKKRLQICKHFTAVLEALLLVSEHAQFV